MTDDTAIAEHAGLAVLLVTGNEDNFKITTQDDLQRAERMAKAMTGETRIGTGFDVHAFGDGNKVILCGIEIPHDRALEGHSDADVAFHAVTDALLGAMWRAKNRAVHAPLSRASLGTGVARRTNTPRWSLLFALTPPTPVCTTEGWPPSVPDRRRGADTTIRAAGADGTGA